MTLGQVSVVDIIDSRNSTPTVGFGHLVAEAVVFDGDFFGRDKARIEAFYNDFAATVSALWCELKDRDAIGFEEVAQAFSGGFKDLL